MTAYRQSGHTIFSGFLINLKEGLLYKFVISFKIIYSIE